MPNVYSKTQENILNLFNKQVLINNYGNTPPTQRFPRFCITIKYNSKKLDIRHRISYLCTIFLTIAPFYKYR